MRFYQMSQADEVPLEEVWSDAARKAALAARQRRKTLQAAGPDPNGIISPHGPKQTAINTFLFDNKGYVQARKSATKAMLKAAKAKNREENDPTPENHEAWRKANKRAAAKVGRFQAGGFDGPRTKQMQNQLLWVSGRLQKRTSEYRNIVRGRAGLPPLNKRSLQTGAYRVKTDDMPTRQRWRVVKQ